MKAYTKSILIVMITIASINISNALTLKNEDNDKKNTLGQIQQQQKEMGTELNNMESDLNNLTLDINQIKESVNKSIINLNKYNSKNLSSGKDNRNVKNTKTVNNNNDKHPVNNPDEPSDNEIDIDRKYFNNNELMNISFGLGYKYINSIGSPSIPALNMDIKFPILDKLQIGPTVSYYSENYGTSNISYGILGAKASYNVAKENNLAFNLNGLLAFKFDNDALKANIENSKSVILYGITVDIKYNFNNTFGIFAEAGFGFSMLTAGLFYSL